MKLIVFLFSFLLPLVLIANPLLTETDPVIGQIGSKKILLSAVEDKEINDLRINLYKAINTKLRTQALKELAKTDKTFQNTSTTKISDKEAKAFYNKNQLAQRGPFESLKPQIIQYLTIQKLRGQIDRLYAKAIAQGKVKLLLKEPAVMLAQVPVATAFVWGPKKAKVMMLEFSDYQCPFCGRVQPTLNEIRKEYKGKASFGYRHFPLQFHERADEAAVAVECAREQGKFETYHNLLFSHQQALSDQDLKKYAKKIGLKNLKKFNQCLDSEKYKAQVQKDIADAASIGIRGTPSFLIGLYDPKTKQLKGEMVSGALPKEELTKLLDKYIAL